MNGRVTIQEIGPVQAEAMLSNILPAQRKQRDGYIGRLAEEMKSGRWRLSNDAVLRICGKLGNGQHRLRAVVLSGKPQKFIVLETDDEELYKLVDCGLRRTVADSMQLTTYAQDIAAMAAWVVRHDLGTLTPSTHKSSGKKAAFTRGTVLQYIEQNLEVLQLQAAFCCTLQSTRRIVTASLAGAVLHLASRKQADARRAEDFIERLYTGQSINDAAYDMRERLIRDNASRAKLPKSYVFGLLIKSMRCHLKGTRLAVLKLVEGEQFPSLDK